GDQLLEAATHEEEEGLTPAEVDARIRELKIRCPNCKGEFGPARPFNMMFPLEVGPTGKDRAYLRPETAQGVYLNFKREFEALRRRSPALACLSPRRGAAALLGGTPSPTRRVPIRGARRKGARVLQQDPLRHPGEARKSGRFQRGRRGPLSDGPRPQRP